MHLEKAKSRQLVLEPKKHQFDVFLIGVFIDKNYKMIMFNQFKGVFLFGNIVKASKLKLILYNPYQIQTIVILRKPS